MLAITIQYYNVIDGHNNIVYLLCHSAELHSDVTSRIPNANHHHPFPTPLLWRLVVPAVEVLPLKCVNACYKN